ncbi:MAG: glucose-6-phosphate isomerase family protein [Patescibacteria group bacterium]|nr:glucose-6-phosphate isomerase family protein [Patescibacteria group bacterium]
MEDIKDKSGLKIELSGSKLLYDKEDFQVEPAVRLFADAEKVYQDKTDGKEELYYMYRYFERDTDKDKFVKSDTEYDITVINPGKVGEEYIKTKGHYHALVPGTDISYPEVYEVIKGEVEYLIQTKPNDKKETNVVIITAKEGEKIIVPPGYGHISINTTERPGVESNLQKRDLPAGADYGGFEYYHGGAMYRTEEGWIKNPEYVIRSVRYVSPKEKPEWGLTKDKPLYTSFIETPEKFDFIVRPQNYDFSDIWLESK